ncbi:hypothetical protein [Bradyrhizobium sp. USDA 4451]
MIEDHKVESHGLVARNVVKATNRANSIWLHLLLVYRKGSALLLCLELQEPSERCSAFAQL